MRLFVTGVNGQLGHDVIKEIYSRGHYGIGSGSATEYTGVCDCDAINSMEYVQLNITDKEKVYSVLSKIKPDVVVHCAAWTAVDLAEDEENRDKVFDINVNGTRYIAEACKKLGIKMMYISTDYVFNGKGNEPWKADCKDYHPLGVYGKTKCDGEIIVSSTLQEYFIVRIAWVFGINGKNFVKTMINVGKKHNTVRVVNDQFGTPTYTKDLARLLIDLCESEKYGYYHATNEGGYITWFDFCNEIYRQYGLETKVIPVTTEEYGLTKARRPENGRLDRSKISEMGFEPLPDWKDALARYLLEVSL